MDDTRMLAILTGIHGRVRSTLQVRVMGLGRGSPFSLVFLRFFNQISCFFLFFYFCIFFYLTRINTRVVLAERDEQYLLWAFLDLSFLG